MCESRDHRLLVVRRLRCSQCRKIVFQMIRGRIVRLEETLGRLEYAAQRQWYAAVTSDCGSGKTTKIRRFTEVLDPVKYKCFIFRLPS
jgi:hypothetical protein